MILSMLTYSCNICKNEVYKFSSIEDVEKYFKLVEHKKKALTTTTNKLWNIEPVVLPASIKNIDGCTNCWRNLYNNLINLSYCGIRIKNEDSYAKNKYSNTNV